MILPFFLALLSALGLVFGKRKAGVLLWLATLAIVLCWFRLLVTRVLPLSF